MQKLILLLIISIFISQSPSVAQDDYFIIIGKINGLNKGIVSLATPKNDSTFQIENNNIEIKNGFFQFSGKLNYPRRTRLIITDTSTYYSDWFYIANCKQNLYVDFSQNTINVESDSDVFHEDKITFSKFNDSLYTIKIRYYEIIDSLLEIKQSKVKIDSIYANISKLSVIYDNYLENQILRNRNSYIALTELYHSIEFGKQDNFKLFELFSPELKESILGAKVKNRLLKFNYLNVGSLFPSFNLLDTNFTSKTLNVINQAKYTLIDFWFTNCGTCVKQFPKLNNIYSKYNNFGFQLIGISTELKKYQEEWKNGLIRYKPLWPQFWDVDHIQTSEYGIKFFPTNFLLDSKGIIIARNIEIDELLVFLEKNLN